MSRNGSGTYSLPAGNPVVTGTTISSTWANSTLSDIATALTQSIAYDGQTTPIANLPMGGYIHTGVGNATARTNYASAAQVEDGTLNYLTTVSGTNTITATAPISMSAYVAGQTFRFIAAGANTGAVTLNLNSIGAKAVTRDGTTALVANDIVSGGVYQVVYDGTQFQLTNSSNASVQVTSFSAGTTGLTPSTATTGAITLAGTLNVANGGTGLTSLTAGYIPFGAGTSALGSSANLFWDNTNNRLGIGTSSPTDKLEVSGSGTTYISAVRTSASASRVSIGAGSGVGVILASDNASGAVPLTFYTGTTEKMRLDASGNLGLGVTPSAWASSRVAFETPSIAILSYNAQTAMFMQNAYFNGTSYVYKNTNYASNYWQSLGTHQWYTAPSGTAGTNITFTQAMTLDSSGNLGLGVTPSAWWSSAKAFQIGLGGYVQGRTASGDVVEIGANQYINSSVNRTYINTAAASYYEQNSGQHRWFNAPSGTAGTTATFTQAMTLDASGNLGLGSTSPASFSGYAAITLNNATSGGIISFAKNNTEVGRVQSFDDGTNQVLQSEAIGAASQLRFRTNGAERIRVDISGNMQIETGAVMPYAPAPASISTTATLTNANIQSQIINTTGTSYTVTMPLGTTLETLASWVSGGNTSYDFFVINTASGTITMAVNTGVTSLGGLTIATGVSAHFRIRRVTANTFVLYRLS